MTAAGLVGRWVRKFVNDLKRIDKMRITLAIDDPEFALMIARSGLEYEHVEVPQVPVDVIVYCLHLRRYGKAPL